MSDSPDFVRDVCEWIENEPGLIVVATPDNRGASLTAVDVLRPDLVLIDVAIAGMDVVEAARKVKARSNAPAVVLIARHDPEDLAQTARDAGADAVVSARELGASVECILRALGARPRRPDR